MKEENGVTWGFVSPDGFFQPVSTLTTTSLEFVSKTRVELQALLQEHLALEHYEKCAVIRDEIARRDRK